jgi:hypothetical protein
MNVYQLDTDVTLQATFVQLSNGVAVDPTTVNLFMSTPDGHKTTYSTAMSQITRIATGIYQFTLETLQSGVYVYKWQGIGAVVVTSPDTRFQVQQSLFIP